MRVSREILIAAAIAFLIWTWWASHAPTQSGPIPQEAFLWQRDWRSIPDSNLVQRSEAFRKIIFLAAEVAWEKGHPRTTRVRPDYPALVRAGISTDIGLALRIGAYPGPFQEDDAVSRQLTDLAVSLVQEAQTNGVTLQEFQVDFDCAESKLDGYGVWLRQFQEAIRPVPLTITALPAWLDQPAFGRIASQVTDYVLQVHSLEKPEASRTPVTLCDPDKARQAMIGAGRLGIPFRVSLPTYGYLLAFEPGPEGRFLGLTAEGPQPDWPPNATLRELRTSPADMAMLVRDWTRQRPEAMQGLVWFRLPLGEEQRNWRWPTLASVMKGHTPASHLTCQLTETNAPLVESELVNDGDGDYTGRVRLILRWHEERQVASDALQGFKMSQRRDDPKPGHHLLEYESLGPIHLPAQSSRPVGWLRLAAPAQVETELILE